MRIFCFCRNRESAILTRQRSPDPNLLCNSEQEFHNTYTVERNPNTTLCGMINNCSDTIFDTVYFSCLETKRNSNYFVLLQCFMFHKLYKTILTDVCCLCDTEGLSGLDLCQQCHKRLPHNHFSCSKCAAPVAYSPPGVRGSRLCGACLSNPGYIDEAVIPYLYRPPVDFMIKRLKFSEENKFSRLLGELLADAIERRYDSESAPDSRILFCRFLFTGKDWWNAALIRRNRLPAP